jgi:hypothetical protein
MMFWITLIRWTWVMQSERTIWRKFHHIRAWFINQVRNLLEYCSPSALHCLDIWKKVDFLLEWIIFFPVAKAQFRNGIPFCNLWLLGSRSHKLQNGIPLRNCALYNSMDFWRLILCSIRSSLLSRLLSSAVLQQWWFCTLHASVLSSQ